MRFWDVQWDNWVRHWTVFVRIAKVLMVPLYKLEKMPLPFHVCHPTPPLSSLAPCAGCPSARHNQHSCMRTLVSWLARCPVVLRRAVALILVHVSLKSRPNEDEALPYSVFGTLFLMLLSAFQTSHSFSLRHLSVLRKMWSRLLCAFLPPASSLASPILLKSRPITHLGVRGPTGTGLALGFWSHFFPFPHKHPLTWPCSSPQAVDGKRLITYPSWPLPTWLPLPRYPPLSLQIL